METNNTTSFLLMIFYVNVASLFHKSNKVEEHRESKFSNPVLGFPFVLF